jgi:hypothetical protein
VAATVADAVEHHGAKRALKPQEREKLDDVLARVVANLVHHYLTGDSGGVVVSRSKKVLGAKPTRYQPLPLPETFPKWLDALDALGFARQRKGVVANWPEKAKRTTIRSAAKLIRLIQENNISFADIRDEGLTEIIILSRSKLNYWDDDPYFRRMDYKDDATTRRYRSELQATNAWLANADIQFDASVYDRRVDVYARRLYRRFTQGRFDSGGRLFGGFWQSLPNKSKRFPYSVRLRGLRIDGEPVTGLDYSQLNPILCHSVADAEPPLGDAYTIPGLEQYRDGVKRVFNAMLFHHPVIKFPKRTPKEIEEGTTFFPKGIKCGGVVAMILHYHPNLKSVLSGGNIGHHLQLLESQIMMRVLRRCHQSNIVALPVFDAVVVKASAEAPVREIMLQEFKAVSGLNITVKRELPVPGADSEQANSRRHIVELRGRAGPPEGSGL